MIYTSVGKDGRRALRRGADFSYKYKVCGGSLKLYEESGEETSMEEVVSEFLGELGFEGGVHTRDVELKAGLVDGVLSLSRGGRVRVLMLDWEKKGGVGGSARVDLRGLLKGVMGAVRGLYEF